MRKVFGVLSENLASGPDPPEEPKQMGKGFSQDLPEKTEFNRKTWKLKSNAVRYAFRKSRLKHPRKQVDSENMKNILLLNSKLKSKSKVSFEDYIYENKWTVRGWIFPRAHLRWRYWTSRALSSGSLTSAPKVNPTSSTPHHRFYGVGWRSGRKSIRFLYLWVF